MKSNADSFRKELENIRRNIEKSENSFAETQTELKALKSRMNNAEEQISDLKDRIIEITESGPQTENPMKKHERIIKDLRDNIKWDNLHIVGIPEGEEREEGIENIFEEIISENIANLKETDTKGTMNVFCWTDTDSKTLKNLWFPVEIGCRWGNALRVWNGNAIKSGCDDCCTTINVIKFNE